jgi:hypothetical protein
MPNELKDVVRPSYPYVSCPAQYHQVIVRGGANSITPSPVLAASASFVRS